MTTILNTQNRSDDKNTRLKNILACVLCILITLAIGAISGYITFDKTNGWWFDALKKPSLQPPDKVFGSVWFTLYLLMGISLYLVWKSPKTNLRTSALWIFGIQLFLNFCWSILFFSFHLLFISIIDIALIWVLILYMIFLFRITKASAGYLNIPYLFWLSFATVLNISIWILN